MSKNGYSHSDSVQTITRGEVYKHATDGRVEVSAIWKGKEWTDTASRSAVEGEDNPIVVRYIPYEKGDWSDEMAGTLDEFLNAIEPAE